MVEETETVADDAAEVVAPNSVEHEDHDHGPSNADIIDRLDALPNAIADAVAAAIKPTEPETSPAEGDDDTSHDAPDHGEQIPIDSNPASVPWTHRGFKG